MNKIVAVRKDTNGVIEEVKLQDGRELTVQDAVAVLQQEGIEGITTGTSALGEMYLRGIGDGDPTNNLDNLPLF